MLWILKRCFDIPAVVLSTRRQRVWRCRSSLLNRIYDRIWIKRCILSSVHYDLVITGTLSFLKRQLCIKVRWLRITILILVTHPDLCCCTIAATGIVTNELCDRKFAFDLIEHLHVSCIVFSNLLLLSLPVSLIREVGWCEAHTTHCPLVEIVILILASMVVEGRKWCLNINWVWRHDCI